MNDQTGYDATIQLPEGASTLAPHVDSLYYDIFWISVAFFVGIVGCMVWFAYRFRRKKGVKSKPPGHHTALELFWTFSPLLLLGYMFHQGFDGFMRMSIAPENALNIRAEARAAALRLRAAQERVAYYRQVILPVRQQVLDQTQLQYNAMQVGVFQLLQARQDQVRAGAEYIESLRTYWLARARAEAIAAGHLPTGRASSDIPQVSAAQGSGDGGH